MNKSLFDQLEEIENGDEAPLSNRVFARFMRHLCFNHLAHLQGEVRSLKVLFYAVILPILLLILATIIGLGLTR